MQEGMIMIGEVITMADGKEAHGYEQVECEKQEIAEVLAPRRGDIKEALARLI